MSKEEILFKLAEESPVFKLETAPGKPDEELIGAWQRWVERQPEYKAWQEGFLARVAQRKKT